MTADRIIVVDGTEWAVSPSGFVTQYVGDEFGLVFRRLSAGTTELRFTRYSPRGGRAREASFAELPDHALLELFRTSQPSVRSPEGGYRS